MPIRPETKHLYPPRKEWAAIRQRILSRAKDCCEKCGVENYAVWCEEEDGTRSPTGGNMTHDMAARGELTYAEARDFVEHMKFIEPEVRYFVIVLTIAHLDQDPTNNADTNLKALCQKCHLHHDRHQHRRNAEQTRGKRRAKAIPFNEART